MVKGVGQRGRHDQERKRKRSLGGLVFSSPGDSSVAFLVSHGVWSTGSHDVGLIQSTRASRLINICFAQLSARGVVGAKDAPGTATQSHAFPSISMNVKKEEERPIS